MKYAWFSMLLIAWNLISAQQIEHTVYLVGDAGSVTEKALVIKGVNQLLKNEGDNATVLFLGDNIYPSGLPEKEDDERIKAETFLQRQIDVAKGTNAKAIFVAGNHDWNHYSAGGKKAIERQANWINKHGNDGQVTYLPKGGCPGPAIVEVKEDLTLILFDSQWFLHPREEEGGIDKGCKVKSREELMATLEEAVNKYDNGNIVLAMHHPTQIYGTHGTYYHWVHHIFPLREINSRFWIPLPIIGSIYPFGRTMYSSKQDTPNDIYQRYIKQIENRVLYRKKRIFMASGHEHNLQYFKDKGIHHIISGSGSKTKLLPKRAGAEYAAAKKGFSRLLFFSDGHVETEFYTIDGKGDIQKSFSKLLEQPYLEAGEKSTYDIPEKTVKAKVSELYNTSSSFKFWFGDHYRSAWSSSIEAPTFNLSTFKGGVIPVKKGGGQQTTSIRLKVDKTGEQFTMRSLNKNVAAIVPEIAKNTVWTHLAQDQISMAHPYGAFVIPPLAKKAGIYHTTPFFAYVPKQDRLGDYNKFANQLFLIETRPKGDMSQYENFGNSKKVIGYTDVVKKTQQNVSHQVDQQFTLRSRLFDLWVGDWDRHDDQWRWARFQTDSNTIYRPIPRDRDQVFINVDGFLPKILSGNPALKQFQSFENTMPDVKGLSFNAKHFDRAFLTKLEWKDWEKEVDDLISKMDDKTIEEAIRNWPDTLYNIDGKEITQKLKNRKLIWKQMARELYDYLALKVSVVGTHKKDHFIVNRVDNDHTEVLVVSNHKNKKVVHFHRIFKRSETKEIRLYGLQGKDKFEINGNTKKGILVRIIGGEGDDVVKANSNVSGLRNMIKVYDNLWSPESVSTKDLTKNISDSEYVNNYERKDFQYNSFFPVATADYNPDDGFLLGGGFRSKTFGFKKRPFKSDQSLKGRISFKTGAFLVKYKGEFIDIGKRIDIYAEARWLAPSTVRNYFGYGNNTSKPNESSSFYYLRHDQQKAFLSFQKTLSSRKIKFRLGPYIEVTNIYDNRNRSARSDQFGLSEGSFGRKYYAGIKLHHITSFVDNEKSPSRGFRYSLNANALKNLKKAESIAQVNGNFTFFIPLRAINTTLASDFGGGHNWGNFEIYQAQVLGTRNNLRGYRSERFAGRTRLYHNTELRYDIGIVRTPIIPMHVGLIGLFDYGRVWAENEHSDTWHSAYGGGLYINIAKFIIAHATYSISLDNKLIEGKLRYKF